MTELGVFAKYWEPGKVKTRLATTIGARRASDLYRRFTELTLRNLEEATPARSVVYWPPTRKSEFKTIVGSHWELIPQCDGDLGCRMSRYLADRFDRGRKKVVIVGSDSPTLPSGFVTDAVRLLDSHDVVLGPSHDGGYYLIATRNRIPPVFDGIDWSTPTVWSQTTSRLVDRGVTFATLPPWHDVDDIQGLKKLVEELEGQCLQDKAATSLLSLCRESLRQ